MNLWTCITYPGLQISLVCLFVSKPGQHQNNIELGSPCIKPNPILITERKKARTTSTHSLVHCTLNLPPSFWRGPLPVPLSSSCQNSAETMGSPSPTLPFMPKFSWNNGECPLISTMSFFGGKEEMLEIFFIKFTKGGEWWKTNRCNRNVEKVIICAFCLISLCSFPLTL